jgi:hypothetical protein
VGRLYANAPPEQTDLQRVSTTLLLAARPVAWFAPDRGNWTSTLFSSFTVAAGGGLEFLVFARQSATRPAWDVATWIDVPLSPGAHGGVALRLEARRMETFNQQIGDVVARDARLDLLASLVFSYARH